MIKYTRRTRGRSIPQTVIAEARKLKCSIHMLKSDVPMTFEEVVEAHEEYNDGYYHQGPFSYTASQIQKGLEKLVELGLVEAEGQDKNLNQPETSKTRPRDSETGGEPVRTRVRRVYGGRKADKAGRKGGKKSGLSRRQSRGSRKR